jgi:hypothetical protein
MIVVTYKDEITKKFNTFHEIVTSQYNNEDVIGIDCSGIQLTELPELPNNKRFRNLKNFDCSDNQLLELPSCILECDNLEILNCGYNKLITLPVNIKSPLHNLKYFYIDNNQLSTLPLWILNCSNLRDISIYDNPLEELSPQIERFIKKIQNDTTKQINVYNDNQNAHNSNIEESIKNSINNITTRTDLPKYNKESLIDMISNDDILKCKKQLLEYCNDEYVHDLLLLRFPELLWYVMNTIKSDFKEEEQKQIKTILNQEMKDAEGTCLTGKMNRVVNCLNGFSKLVDIKIKNSEQIGNIILIIKEKLELENNYSVDKHKKLVIKELEERGYEKDVIESIGFYILSEKIDLFIDALD